MSGGGGPCAGVLEAPSTAGRGRARPAGPGVVGVTQGSVQAGQGVEKWSPWKEMLTPPLSQFPAHTCPWGQQLCQQVDRNRSCHTSRKAGARDPRGEDRWPPSLCSYLCWSEALRGGVGPHPAGRGRSGPSEMASCPRPHGTDPTAGPGLGRVPSTPRETEGAGTRAHLPPSPQGRAHRLPFAWRAERSGEARGLSR